MNMIMFLESIKYQNLKGVDLMKKITSLLLCAIFTLVFAGFIHIGSASAATGNEVKLLQSIYQDGGSGGSSSLRGSIEVENIASHKQVNVVWRTSEQGWTTTPAIYAAPTEGNYEAWEFSFSYGFRRGPLTIEYYIEYIVDGNRYIDNNNGANYWGDYYMKAILNKPAVKMNCIGFIDPRENKISGSIFLKNISDHKDVKVVYTTDSWATVKTASAYYGQALPNGIELWRFETLVSADVNKIEAAVMYTVDGATYWDTNINNRNYIFQR